MPAAPPFGAAARPRTESEASEDTASSSASSAAVTPASASTAAPSASTAAPSASSAAASAAASSAEEKVKRLWVQVKEELAVVAAEALRALLVGYHTIHTL